MSSIKKTAGIILILLGVAMIYIGGFYAPKVQPFDYLEVIRQKQITDLSQLVVLKKDENS